MSFLGLGVQRSASFVHTKLTPGRSIKMNIGCLADQKSAQVGAKNSGPVLAALFFVRAGRESGMCSTSGPISIMFQIENFRSRFFPEFLSFLARWARPKLFFGTDFIEINLIKFSCF
jgi:hypothetical protein